MSVTLLSILVPTIHSRLRTFYPRLIDDLFTQSIGKSVEILSLYDNGKWSVGQKRNALLTLAQGAFLSFVDDDDRVAPTYIEDVTKCIRNNMDADVICFHCEVRKDGGPPQLGKYSILNRVCINTPTLWTGHPSHTMVWKSRLAKSASFPDKNFAEDVTWSEQLARQAKKEVQIDKVLYYYDFDSSSTATRHRGW